MKKIIRKLKYWTAKIVIPVASFRLYVNKEDFGVYGKFVDEEGFVLYWDLSKKDGFYKGSAH